MLYVYYIHNVGNDGKLRLEKVGIVKSEVENENFHLWSPTSGVWNVKCEVYNTRILMLHVLIS